MNPKLQIKTQITLVAVFLLSVLGAGQVWSQPVTDEYYLAAQQFTRTMPGGEVITFWGFAQYDDSNFTTLTHAPTVPGPMLEVGNRINTLTVHLKNDLTEPISLVIPPLPAAMDPNYFTDSQSRRRVRSFTYETHPGEIRQYTWSNLRAGTFVYHSGTHPAVQVQMGLYGGAKIYWNGPDEVYDGVTVDSSVDIFFSEVDPNLHNAVATGNYGPGKAVTSTIGYKPKYFLINGDPYSKATLPIIAGDPNDTILVRFLNAGLESHVPVLHGIHMNVIGEEGFEYPFVREQYSLLVAAGQAKDAIITPPPVDAIYPIYDRMLNLTNNDNSPGGMIVKLQVGEVAPNDPPVINSISADPNVIIPGACTTQLFVDAFDTDSMLYSWSSEGGIGSFNDPSISNPIFTFPGGMSPGMFTFTVYVSDGMKTTVGTIDVEILPPPEGDLIIDNRDPGASFTGTWKVSGGANPWETDSVYSDQIGDTFTFQGARNGENNVYLRWTPWSSRYSVVPVEIFDGTTSLGTIDIAQSSDPNANTWFPLGTYTFTGTARIVITVDHGESFSTNADAVRFTSTYPAYVDHIGIVGPTIVGDEGPTADYDIRVYKSNGTSFTTEADLWTVIDTGTSIDPSSGVLTVPNVLADTPAKIIADYTIGGCTFIEELDITIVDGNPPTEVIIDNADTVNTSSSGDWYVSGGSNPYLVNSFYCRDDDDDTFTFHANLANAPYAVYLYWTGWRSRLSSVPIRITDGSTDVNVTVNQQLNPSQWIFLGYFNLSGDVDVTITSLGEGSTCADAVKFTPVTLLTDIIIDNGQPGTSSTGTWRVSSGANPYGSNSLWSRSVNGMYTYHIANLTGTFDVYARWTQLGSRSTSVPIQILDGGSIVHTENVNQLTNGSQWRLLKSAVNFSTDVKIVIVSENADFSTNADAIKLVPAP